LNLIWARRRWDGWDGTRTQRSHRLDVHLVVVETSDGSFRFDTQYDRGPAVPWRADPHRTFAGAGYGTTPEERLASLLGLTWMAKRYKLDRRKEGVETELVENPRLVRQLA
jgi:hypothetical protein